jgi:hypothetical protein
LSFQELSAGEGEVPTKRGTKVEPLGASEAIVEMKRTEADRLYHKYTEIGATVEFKFNREGGVDWLDIKKSGWIIIVSDAGVEIRGFFPAGSADILVDYLLQADLDKNE